MNASQASLLSSNETWRKKFAKLCNKLSQNSLSESWLKGFRIWAYASGNANSISDEWDGVSSDSLADVLKTIHYATCSHPFSYKVLELGVIIRRRNKKRKSFLLLRVSGRVRKTFFWQVDDDNPVLFAYDISSAKRMLLFFRQTTAQRDETSFHSLHSKGLWSLPLRCSTPLPHCLPSMTMFVGYAMCCRELP